MTGSAYPGSELELFARAANWKRYFAQYVQQFLGDTVLEVGAGMGGTTVALCNGRQRRWLCLEPDRELLALLASKIAKNDLPSCCEARQGTIQELRPSEQFGTILYLDVLEHIENDLAEIGRAVRHLTPGGHLLVLAPAHNWLFSRYDEAIGHFRRYTRRSLQSVAGKELTLVQALYLDSVGLLASLGNRIILRASLPTQSQIAFWDRFMVPISRVVDPLLGHRAGKSVIVVWERT